MIHRPTAPDPRRSVGRMLLAAWLLMAGGCAQMPFPELPAALTTRSAADAGGAEEGAAEENAADEDAAAADAEVATAAEPAPAPEPGKLFEWSGDGLDITRVVIDTNAQVASFYVDDARVGWTTIATGVASHPTPRGQFSILEKVRDKRSNLYGKIVGHNGTVIRASAHGRDPVPRGARFVGASMPHFMRLTYDGIGMHAGPIPNPGQPASHGCIRMPPKMAAAVFEHVGPGTAVTVVGDGPDYGNYAARIARQQAEERARRAAAAAAAEGTPLDALDAEIEALEEAGVEVTGPDDADAGAAADATSDNDADAASNAPGRRSEADADADTPTGTRADTSSGADAESPTAGAGDTSAAARQRGASAGEPPPRERRSSGEGENDIDARADAGSTATPAHQSGGAPPQRRSRPEAEPTPGPEPPPAEPAEPAPDYGPPAPPPTIRAAAIPPGAPARGRAPQATHGGPQAAAACRGPSSLRRQPSTCS